MKIAIASGKGGTGKTFVSTNLFYAAQKTGEPVTLIDCDAEEPNVTEFISGDVYASQKVFQHIPVIDTEKCTFCGKCHEWCNYKAIVIIPEKKYIRVLEELCHDCGACLAACQFGAITEKEKRVGVVRSMYSGPHAEIIEARSEVGVYSPVPVIKEAIAEANGHFLSLLDSPPGISCPFIATVVPADFVVLVTEPTPFGLNDLKLSVETLQEIGKPFGVVINRAGLGNTEVHDWLNENQIPILMEIPFDREIARIYSVGRVLSEENPEYEKRFAELLKNIKKQVE
ncbi:MAG: ATP-binding protein [Prolixibacteraceae bacterium]|jgi:MinD superfamily P-loop ATPase|nr:ATP-binding protein [Prolixibacteraceae bacterium]